MADQSKRARGRWGEDRAVALYRRDGFEILDRNWRSAERHLPGELDVVAARADLLIFCEVKARRSGGFGGAAAAVTEAKQQQVRALAASWLRQHDLAPGRVRFDVVAIDGVRLEHYESAF